MTRLEELAGKVRAAGQATEDARVAQGIADAAARDAERHAEKLHLALCEAQMSEDAAIKAFVDEAKRGAF